MLLLTPLTSKTLSFLGTFVFALNNDTHLFFSLLDCGFNIDRLAAISFWDLGFWGVWLLRESQEMEVENRLFVLFMVPLIDRQLYFYSDQGKKKMVDGIFYL